MSVECVVSIEGSSDPVEIYRFEIVPRIGEAVTLVGRDLPYEVVGVKQTGVKPGDATPDVLVRITVRRKDGRDA